jgi:transcriptional regulator with GAF, ATPase, and Fis domain
VASPLLPTRAMGPDPATLALEALREIERGLSLAPDVAQGLSGALRVLRTHLGLEAGTVSLAAEPSPPLPCQRPEGAPHPAARLQDGEREQVVHALARAGHVQARAARLLGMTVRQLRYRIAKYGIPVERF